VCASRWLTRKCAWHVCVAQVLVVTLKRWKRTGKSTKKNHSNVSFGLQLELPVCGRAGDEGVVLYQYTLNAVIVHHGTGSAYAFGD
jgi:hypothetical protein